MRLQLDARLLFGGGIGRYLREIAGRWLAEPDVERLRFFGRPEELRPWLDLMDVRRIGEIEPWVYAPYSPAAHVRWRSALERAPWRADVSFFPSHDAPIFALPRPSVVAVHDLLHLDAPDGFPLWKRAGARFLLHSVLRRADRIVTVSRASEEAILAFEPSVRPRLHVVPNGVSAVFRPLEPAEMDAAARRWGDVRPFLLSVGPAKAHKNLAQSVRVLAELTSRGHAMGLVLVTPRTPSPGPLLTLAADLGVRERVHVLHAPSDTELRELYALAEAVLVPSLVEGCGLPALEGRACGGRVLVADRPWGREFADGAEPPLAPEAPGAWAERVLSGRPPGPADDRRTPSWEAAARATLDVIRSVVGE